MQREPMNAPSSTITGRAPGGSSTPPIPTPPARCTFAPICAPEPTVAHVSTIVFGPTQAPMFTYDGISTTPAREERAVPRHRGRHDAHAELLVARLERDLVVVLERARPRAAPSAASGSSRGSPPGPPRARPSRRRGLGDAHLAAVERGDRLVGGHSASSRIAAARSHSVLGGHERKPDVALAGRPEERARARRGSRARAGRRANGSEGPSTASQRKKVASPPAEPQALPLEHGQQRLPLAAVELAHGVDVSLVGPGGDRRALHELLRRRPERRAERRAARPRRSRGAQTKPER